MMEDRYSTEHLKKCRKAPTEQVPEARYGYYRRCQVFRKNGEQCKAPAETGALICHAHAGQLAMAVRRESERRRVLAEAVAEMRRLGNAEYEMKDLFMDLKGIQVTLAKMAQALIHGRIDCKTAGRLVVHLQTASKLLWMAEKARARTTAETPTPTSQHRPYWGPRARRRGEELRLPQNSADERRLSRVKASTTKDTPLTPLSQAQGRSGQAMKIWVAKHLAANQGEKPRINLMAEALTFTDIRGRAHDPPECARAA